MLCVIDEPRLPALSPDELTPEQRDVYDAIDHTKRVLFLFARDLTNRGP